MAHESEQERENYPGKEPADEQPHIQGVGTPEDEIVGTQDTGKGEQEAEEEVSGAPPSETGYEHPSTPRQRRGSQPGDEAETGTDDETTG